MWSTNVEITPVSLASLDIEMQLKSPLRLSWPRSVGERLLKIEPYRVDISSWVLLLAHSLFSEHGVEPVCDACDIG